MSGRGRFLTVEGGEGVGKSLLLEGLARALRDAGRPVVLTREPGGTVAADRIRGLFAAPPPEEPLVIEAEALLVSAARAQHVRCKILPALAKGAWVLSDRFADSTRVYQGALGGIPSDAIESLISFSTAGLEPELTFLLDCPVEIARERLKGRVAASDAVKRYDEAHAEFAESLRQAFLQLARRFPERFFVLDASRSPESVLEEALRVVKERFG